MRKVLFTLLMSVCVVGFAQEQKKEEPDTSRIRINDEVVLLIVDNLPRDSSEVKDTMPKEKVLLGRGLGGMIFGVSSYSTESGGLDLSGATYEPYRLDYVNSNLIQLNLLSQEIKLIEDKLGWFFSAGIESNLYSFRENNIMVENDSLGASLVPINLNGARIKKNRLTVNYLNLSTLLEATIKEKVHVGFGASLGINLGASSLLKYEQNKTKYKSKVKDRFDTNDFKASLMGKIGYQNFNVFVSYCPPAFGQSSKLFEEGSNMPTLRPYTVGVMLAGF